MAVDIASANVVQIPWTPFCAMIMIIFLLFLICWFLGHREGFRDGYKVGRASIEDHNDR